jgi:dTDP-4-dehydrorhamnose reductase
MQDVSHITILDKQEKDGIQYLDLEHADDFETETLDGTDYLVFLAAVSSPDLCEKDFGTSWKITVEGTRRFIRAALDKGIRVLFFSSDAVFGEDAGIFDEDSPTLAKTAYGSMKKAIEDEFRVDHAFKAIRLSYVVSSADRFIRYCLGCLERDEVAQVFHPFYRNCITVTTVVDIVEWLLNNWDGYPGWVLNVAGPELVSRLRLADELNRISQGRLRYSMVNPGQAFYANRPAITQMRSKYLYELGIIPEMSFTEAFRAEMQGVAQ